MATYAPTTGAPTGASSNVSPHPAVPNHIAGEGPIGTGLSRRQAMGAITIAPVFAGYLATGADAGAVERGITTMNMHTAIMLPRTRVSWDRAINALEAAKIEYEDYRDRVWRPIDDELDRTAPRPDLYFEVTAKNGQTARFHVRLDRLDEWDNHASSIFRAKAAAVRDAWLAHVAACERLGWYAASDELERLGDIQCDLEGELIMTPAPDVAALRWKTEHLFGPEGRDPGGSCASWCEEWTNAFMADVNLLLV